MKNGSNYVSLERLDAEIGGVFSLPILLLCVCGLYRKKEWSRPCIFAASSTGKWNNDYKKKKELK